MAAGLFAVSGDWADLILGIPGMDLCASFVHGGTSDRDGA
jgi:hypothetical protein